MARIKRVLTSAKLRTKATSSQLNVDADTRSISIGRRPDSGTAAYGLIGKANEHSGGASVLDHSVWLDFKYPHVIGVFGSRGSGKSFDLGVAAECISGAPGVIHRQQAESAVLILDIQNQFWTLGFEPDAELSEDANHLAELQKWGLSPSKVPKIKTWSPPRAMVDKTQVNAAAFSEFRLAPSQLSDEDWLTTLGLERFTPMGQALIALLEHRPNSLPAELLDMAKKGTATLDFQESTIEGLRWRLAGLAKSELIGVPGLSIDELCAKGTVSVLLLRELPDSMRQLVTGVIFRLISDRFGKFQQEIRLARRSHRTKPAEDLPQRMWLIVDEAHVLVPSGARTAASGPIIDYVKRGRDAGLSLIFATQQPSAVDSRLMSQVDITFTHTLGFEIDISAAIHRMPTRTSITYQHAGFDLPSLGDAIRTLEPGDCIVADGASGRVFVMRVRPRVTAHGGNHPGQ